MGRSSKFQVLEGGTMDLTDRFDQYQALRGFTSATRKRRRWTLTHFARHCGALDRALTVDVESFVAARRAPASRRAILGDLRAFYKWAVLRDLVDSDPTLLVDPPKVPKRQPSPIPTAELERAINAADRQLRRALMLGAFAGLRVSEIAAIRGEDIWQPTHLVVRNGKGGKDRTVPLHPRLSASLADVEAGPIFGCVSGDHISRQIRALFDSLSIHHRPHDLRHAFGTEAAAVARGDLVLVAGLMGHESVTTTQRYVGYRPDGAAVVAGMFNTSDEPPAAA